MFAVVPPSNYYVNCSPLTVKCLWWSLPRPILLLLSYHLSYHLQPVNLIKKGHYYRRFPEKFPRLWEQLYFKNFWDGYFYNYFWKGTFLVFCATVFTTISIVFFLHKTSDEEKAAESFIEHDNEPTETPLQRMGHRKKLTYMLNIHSIDTSLAKDN